MLSCQYVIFGIETSTLINTGLLILRITSPLLICGGLFLAIGRRRASSYVPNWDLGNNPGSLFTAFCEAHFFKCVKHMDGLWNDNLFFEALNSVACKICEISRANRDYGAGNLAD